MGCDGQTARDNPISHANVPATDATIVAIAVLFIGLSS